MDNLDTQKVMTASSVFSKHYLDSKSMYLYFFNKLPSVSYVYGIDGKKSFEACKEKYASLITSVHEYRTYDRKAKKYEFGETTLILNGDILLEFDDDYCTILYSGLNSSFTDECTLLINQFKQKQRRKPLEINLIVEAGYGIELKPMEIKRTKLDIPLFYMDDFREVDEVIRGRLNKKNDKGIVLLHGLPGTGKTTYLRYLIGQIRKKVLFLSPNVAGKLMNPDFIELLIDNPNTVIIIEDAENIIMDRKLSGSSAVSNLLNISDGLLADFLNVQLICTFNSSLTTVDNALLRKGRLIAKYEFGKLSVSKAQKLSNHLGFTTTINKPMTVAEISNQRERDFEHDTVKILGFRRQLIENES